MERLELNEVGDLGDQANGKTCMCDVTNGRLNLLWRLSEDTSSQFCFRYFSMMQRCVKCSLYELEFIRRLKMPVKYNSCNITGVVVLNLVEDSITSM